jgi:hypothetical protein
LKNAGNPKFLKSFSNRDRNQNLYFFRSGSRNEFFSFYTDKLTRSEKEKTDFSFKRGISFFFGPFFYSKLVILTVIFPTKYCALSGMTKKLILVDEKLEIDPNFTLKKEPLFYVLDLPATTQNFLTWPPPHFSS